MDEKQIEKEKNLIAVIVFWLLAVLFFFPGMWLSYPLLKFGILKPKTGEKRGIAEMINFFLSTFVGVAIFWIAVAIAAAFII
jgi:apolipoprotein N-acyltransferase